MAFTVHQKGALQYLTAEALSPGGAVHAFSTRYGGVSEGPLASLNLGTHRGDRPENVLENYRILGSAVGFQPEDTVFTKQLHTDIVLRVGRADRGTGLLREQQTVCDGIITDAPGVALVCFSADCTPILLYDPVRRAVGAVHAGWRGTAQGIARKAVEAMTREFGCQPEHIRAAIGPCISRCCFETGPEVPEAMLAALGSEAEAAIELHGDKYHVDLKALNRMHLQRAGVQTVDVSRDCTMCQPGRFWSHRASNGVRGSLAAVIMLKEETP